ncbi:MAG: HD domain-containing protein [Proteobacteria bacterium]|nr:HD domain-containing protein [Pseudomonadota bacterium]
MHNRCQAMTLLPHLEDLNLQEKRQLSQAATLSTTGIRRLPEKKVGYRQQFALDADRILHSRAYARYIDKTQVFSLITNDHITHRVLHVQLVARIARTIGRFLHLNEDLIEAIALGHDIGHPPFGHDGEKFLSDLCVENGLAPFQHNIQSVRFLDNLECKGRGWNLTLQVLDGILCHDGEIHSRNLRPHPIQNFADFDRKLQDKIASPELVLMPGTLEGCVVRLADTVAYIGRDIEDAIILGLITRDEIPETCRMALGNTNGTIVYTLVTDLIKNSHVSTPAASFIGFSKEISDTLAELKAFNYEKIYLAPKTKEKSPFIKNCYQKLFGHYLSCLDKTAGTLPEDVDLMDDVESLSLKHYSSEEKVRDFIAGMTDNYFLRQAKIIGCQIPQKEQLPAADLAPAPINDHCLHI